MTMTMIDQSGETTRNIFDRTLSEVGEKLEQLARDADHETYESNPAFIVLSLVIGTMFLGCVYLLSQNYVNEERRAIAEAERSRIAAEAAEIDKMESYRSKISKIIDSYAIHLTNMTSTLSPSSRHNSSAALSEKNKHNDIKTQIPHGVDDCDIPESVTISSHSSDDDLNDIERSTDDTDINEEDQSISGYVCNSTFDVLQSTPTVDSMEQNMQPIPSSSSITSTIGRTHLREAVIGNPCAICLEPFRAGDDIVYCSNGAIQRPHIFHQSCSLDYVVAHPDGVKAPCPCCREVLLPSKEQQRKWECIRCSHGSALTLPELDEP